MPHREQLSVRVVLTRGKPPGLMDATPLGFLVPDPTCYTFLRGEG